MSLFSPIHYYDGMSDEIIFCRRQIITTGEGEARSSRRTLKGKVKFGTGYGHRLVWKVCPKFVGQNVEMMEGIVDAMTGQVLSFQDTVDYFQATGDVYPFSNDGIGEEGKSQQDWPMPFMEVGNTITDTGGNFNIPGAQTAKLTGPYVEMRDICGWGLISGNRQYGIAELTQSNGIDWGGSGGQDCTTPGYGHSPANTHSSRSGFYEVSYTWPIVVLCSLDMSLTTLIHFLAQQDHRNRKESTTHQHLASRQTNFLDEYRFLVQCLLERAS
jgi:hypothetical protein